MKTYEHIAIWHIHKSTYYNTFSQYMVTQAFWWMHINQTEDHHFCKGWTSCSIIREPTMSFSHSPALFSFTLATMKYRKGAPLNPSRIQTNPVPCHTLDVTNTTSLWVPLLHSVGPFAPKQRKMVWKNCPKFDLGSKFPAHHFWPKAKKNDKDRTGVQICHRPPLWIENFEQKVTFSSDLQVLAPQIFLEISTNSYSKQSPKKGIWVHFGKKFSAWRCGGPK